ncbi:hypothetical protein EIP91_009708 [Steccherinum ochraceum]|uniref:Uncharacterized protein n=1 Tax=Steccherinum ochraceum TaxID=92696 RepID=A0A4R0RDZ6_9APHY|nr:hypothetical protein EIP91_009708 [Steccherinum ochraceum]
MSETDHTQHNAPALIDDVTADDDAYWSRPERSAVTPEMRRLLCDPSIPPYLQRDSFSTYVHVNPRKIRELLREKDEDEKEREVQEHSCVGKDIRSSSRSSSATPQQPEWHFGWGGSGFADNRGEAQAYGIARSRAKRLLDQAWVQECTQFVSEDKDATDKPVKTEVEDNSTPKREYDTHRMESRSPLHWATPNPLSLREHHRNARTVNQQLSVRPSSPSVVPATPSRSCSPPTPVDMPSPKRRRLTSAHSLSPPKQTSSSSATATGSSHIHPPLSPLPAGSSQTVRPPEKQDHTGGTFFQSRQNGGGPAESAGRTFGNTSLEVPLILPGDLVASQRALEAENKELRQELCRERGETGHRL